MRIRILLACLGTAMLFGCLTPDNTGNSVVTTVTHTPVDTTPIKNGGWDDFPNKAMPDLQEMSAKIQKLPVPMGIRYDVVPSAPNNLTKVAAASDSLCPDGPRQIYGITIAERNLYVVDTIRYYDTAGVVSCQWTATGTQRVTHDRHIIDLGAGQSWEHIEDSISDQTALPNHRIGGTGLIKLNTGVDLTIDSYWLNMVTPYGETDAVIMDGHLRMTWKGGYSLDLSIVKTMPYKSLDFFPARGDSALGEKIMSGPIRHDTTLVGYFDLYEDHGVLIRDWLGKPVSAP